MLRMDAAMRKKATGRNFCATVSTLPFVMPAEAGTHDKSKFQLRVAVGPGLRRDDELGG